MPRGRQQDGLAGCQCSNVGSQQRRQQESFLQVAAAPRHGAPPTPLVIGAIRQSNAGVCLWISVHALQQRPTAQLETCQKNGECAESRESPALPCGAGAISMNTFQENALPGPLAHPLPTSG